MTPLFLPEVDPHAFFEKQASIAKMPDDDTKWPAHVLSNLHQQLPFLSQYEVDLSLQRVEPEAGFAFGHALLMAKNDPAAATESKNPQNMIKIPVIIADRQLQPFHTFELGGNVYPLTSERVEAALLNPAVFEGPARQPHRQKSLIDQMYPPYQQRQGFGRTVGAGTSSMGVTKLSSAKDEVPPDPYDMTAKQLRTMADLKKSEARDRFEQGQGFFGRTGDRLKAMALPTAAGIAFGAHRGAKVRKAGEGLLDAMQSGAKGSAGVSVGVGTAAGVQKEYGLQKRKRERKRLGMDPLVEKKASFKEAMVQLSFGSGNQVPPSVVLQGTKIKVAPGVQTRMLKYFRVPGSAYVIGIPAKVAAKLEKVRDQASIRKILAPLMREEMKAQRSGRPSQGMFLLFHKGKNGKYTFVKPSPMGGM